MDDARTSDVSHGIDALRAQLSEDLAAHDADSAIAHAMSALESGAVSVDELHGQVLSRILCDIGRDWQRGDSAVWQEHYSAAVVRSIIEVAHPYVVAESQASAGSRDTAVLACPSGEQHDLGLRMLADRMRVAGWHVHYLGADTPATQIAAAASVLRASLIVLSAATHFNRVQMRRTIDTLRQLAPNCKVGVGGPAFVNDPEWAEGELLSDADLGLTSSACE